MPERVIPVGGVAPTAVHTLYQLQDLTRSTGILHEVQARHLKVWAMAALNVDKVEVHYGRQPPVVQFYVLDADLHKGQPPVNLTKCLEYLDELVRFLLGPEYQVIVVWDDDIIWDKLGNGECLTNHRPQSDSLPETKSGS